MKASSKNGTKYNGNVIVNFILKRLNNNDIENIKNNIDLKLGYITEVLVEDTGKLFDENLKSTIKQNFTSTMTIKEGLSTHYGVFNSIKTSYMVLYSIEKITQQKKTTKIEKKINFLNIPTKYAYDIKNKKLNFEEFVLNTIIEEGKIKEYNNFKILKTKVLKNQVIELPSGDKFKLVGAGERKFASTLFLDRKLANEISILLKINDKIFENNTKQSDEIKNTLANIDKILEQLMTAISKFEERKSDIDDIKEQINNIGLINISNEEKRNIIIKLLELVNNGYANFKKINLSTEVGRTKSDLNKEMLKSLKLIDSSITGIYEKKYTLEELEKFYDNKHRK